MHGLSLNVVFAHTLLQTKKNVCSFPFLLCTFSYLFVFAWLSFFFTIFPFLFYSRVLKCFSFLFSFLNVVLCWPLLMYLSLLLETPFGLIIVFLTFFVFFSLYILSLLHKKAMFFFRIVSFCAVLFWTWKNCVSCLLVLSGE